MRVGYARIARRIGATFMKLGRAPTMQVIDRDAINVSQCTANAGRRVTGGRPPPRRNGVGGARAGCSPDLPSAHVRPHPVTDGLTSPVQVPRPRPTAPGRSAYPVRTT